MCLYIISTVDYSHTHNSLCTVTSLIAVLCNENDIFVQSFINNSHFPNLLRGAQKTSLVPGPMSAVMWLHMCTMCNRWKFSATTHVNYTVLLFVHLHFHDLPLSIYFPKRRGWDCSLEVSVHICNAWTVEISVHICIAWTVEVSVHIYIAWTVEVSVHIYIAWTVEESVHIYIAFALEVSVHIYIAWAVEVSVHIYIAWAFEVYVLYLQCLFYIYSVCSISTVL